MPSFVFNKAVWSLSEYGRGRPPLKFVFKALVTSFFCGGHSKAEWLFLSDIFRECVSSMQVRVYHRQSRTAPTGEAMEYYDVEITGAGGVNVFKILKKRFAENVKVTATLNFLSGNGKELNASTEPMSIDSSNGHTHTCTGYLPPFSPSVLEQFERAAVFGRGGLKVIALQFDFPEVQVEGDLPYIQNPPMELEPSRSSVSKLDNLEQLRQVPGKILEEGVCSDLIVTCKIGTEIEAHKCFLSASSPVFERMFKNKMRESLTGQLDMSQMSEKAVRAFLSYVYTKDVCVPEEDIQVAFELMRAGHQYQMSAMTTLMSSIMTRFLQVEANAQEVGVQLAFEIYSFVKKIDGDSDLKGMSIKILRSKWEEWQGSPECRHLFEKNSKAAMELCGDVAKSWT